jgi:hypothetical protein
LSQLSSSLKFLGALMACSWFFVDGSFVVWADERT